MAIKIKIVCDTSAADRLLAKALPGGLKNRQFLKLGVNPYFTARGLSVM